MTATPGSSDPPGQPGRATSGDRTAEDELVDTLYGELRGMAGQLLSHERTGHTLQPTALVHEAWARLSRADHDHPGGGRRRWNDRRHFFNTAARAMRRVLVDHARSRDAKKRGHRAAVTPEVLEELVGSFEEHALDVVALHEALERMGAFDEPLMRLVELRFFAGLSVPETAEALDCSISRVERQWRLARAWLRRDLGT